LADISSPAKEGASVISALSKELGASGDQSHAYDSAQSHTAVEAMRSRLNADASDFKPRVQVWAVALINFGSGVVAESGFGTGSYRVFNFDVYPAPDPLKNRSSYCLTNLKCNKAAAQALKHIKVFS
jgi:hypothetical protein